MKGMPRLTEKNAETLIQENLQEQGWDLTDFDTLTKGYTLPSGREADFVRGRLELFPTFRGKK